MLACSQAASAVYHLLSFYFHLAKVTLLSVMLKLAYLTIFYCQTVQLYHSFVDYILYFHNFFSIFQVVLTVVIAYGLPLAKLADITLTVIKAKACPQASRFSSLSITFSQLSNVISYAKISLINYLLPLFFFSFIISDFQLTMATVSLLTIKYLQFLFLFSLIMNSSTTCQLAQKLKCFSCLLAS